MKWLDRIYSNSAGTSENPCNVTPQLKAPVALLATQVRTPFHHCRNAFSLGGLQTAANSPCMIFTYIHTIERVIPPRNWLFRVCQWQRFGIVLC